MGFGIPELGAGNLDPILGIPVIGLAILEAFAVLLEGGRSPL